MRAKILLSVGLMLCTFQCVKAENTDVSLIDNVVYMQPVSFAAGTQQTLSVRMKNTVGIQTVQFDVVFPDGVTVAKDEDDFELISLSTERTTTKKMDSFSPAFISDGRYRILINSNQGYTFDGTDGEIVTIVVNIANTMAEGDHPIAFEDIVLVDTGSNGFETARVESTITINGVDDGRIKFYETSTSLPAYTAGEKGDVTMYRTIKAGEWSTIVLPFTLTQAKAKAAFGVDVELYEFTGFETVYSDDDDITPDAINIQLTEYTLGAKKSMTGGKPFVIKTSQDIESFEADDVTLAGTVTDVAKADDYDTQGKMTGSLVKATIPKDGLFVSGNKFWYSTGQTAVKGFRCWFELGSVLDKETDFSAPVFFVIGSNPTGIETIGNGQLPEGYYDLKGQRVKHPKKGLYIKNGKKVVIK